MYMQPHRLDPDRKTCVLRKKQERERVLEMDFTRQLALMTSQTSVHTHVSPSQPNMPIKPQQLTSMLAGPSGMMPSMPAAKRQKL